MFFNFFKDIRLSALGLGTMRLPVIDGKSKDIDELQVRAMVDYAFDHGVNYFDTAWGYHGGNSELAIGRALAKYPREKFYLADKFPGYDLSNMPNAKQIFEKQLYKCGVRYFDFYLIHNVCELNIEQYLDPHYNIKNYYVEQKKAGRIRHLGLSNHGRPDVLRRFLDAYGDEMEFCQLQLNWLDWDFQQAKECVEICRGYGLPVWVMEPLRGGRLCKLAPQHKALLDRKHAGMTETEWAFRFLQSLPDTTMILSGMSNMSQLVENITYFDSRRMLSDDECELLFRIGKEMTDSASVPCTGCRYCTAHCPKQLDIPYLLELFNEHNFTGGESAFIAPMALTALPEEKWPKACIACRQCEQLCPQKIKISDTLAEFTRQLVKFAPMMKRA